FFSFFTVAKAVRKRIVVPASKTSKTAGLPVSKRIIVCVSRASARLVILFSPAVNASITKARLDSLLEEGSGIWVGVKSLVWLRRSKVMVLIVKATAVYKL